MTVAPALPAGPVTSALRDVTCRADGNGAAVDLYELLAGLSPRRRIRLDAAGTHVYRDVPMPEVAPGCPWAVYLADSRGRFRLVVWDLDASRAGPVAVAADVARLRGWLDSAGIGYVVARSGPGGGRHVWAGFPAGAAAGLVRAVAYASRAVLPTLDISALCNPVSGAVRPPGSPHRHGGVSTVEGDLAVAARVLRAGNPVERLELLLAALPPAARAAGHHPATSVDAARFVVADPDGEPRLVGQRRTLPPGTDVLVYGGVVGDASAVAWRVLLRCAHARWSRADVAALVANPAATGLEHLRSTPGRSGGRVPRSAQEQQAVLARQWARAVARAAEHLTTRPARDPDRDARADRVAAVVASVEAAAEAVGWRWATQAGPADRAVLRAVLLQALVCRRLDVALDVRRAALMTGYGRTTAAAALRRLAAAHPIDGPAWIVQVTPASGRQAAVWRPLPPAEFRPVDTGRTQGRKPAPRSPLGPISVSEVPVSDSPIVLGNRGEEGQATGPVSGLVGRLRSHLDLTSSDVFCHGGLGGLGHSVGRTYAAVAVDQAVTVDQVAARTGYSPATTRAHLARLAAFRLVKFTRSGRIRLGSADLATVAARLGTTGTTARRAATFAVEREVYGWWRDELAWRRTRGKPRHRHRVGPVVAGQAAIPVPAGPRATYGRFPARPGGRADYTTARRTLTGHTPTVAAVDPVTTAVAHLAATFRVEVLCRCGRPTTVETPHPAVCRACHRRRAA